MAFGCLDIFVVFDDNIATSFDEINLAAVDK